MALFEDLSGIIAFGCYLSMGVDFGASGFFHLSFLHTQLNHPVEWSSLDQGGAVLVASIGSPTVTLVVDRQSSVCRHEAWNDR